MVVTVVGAGFSGAVIGMWSTEQQNIQKYVQKLWSNNEIQLSDDRIFQEINAFRKDSNLPQYQEDIGICNVARYAAELFWGEALKSWGETTQKFQTESPFPDIALGKVQELCPQCTSLSKAGYVSVRPGPCENLEKEKV